MGQPVSERNHEIFNTLASFFRFMSGPLEQKSSNNDPEILDFVFGNPHEMPLASFTAALQRWSVPQNIIWHAYKLNEPESQAIVAASLRERRGLPFEDEDIFLTNGAFAALTVTLDTIVDAGDEVIYISPPWFFYEALIVKSGAKAVRVQINPESFDLDLAAIEAAITPRTRAIIINSPHNPTGKIYPPETLTALAQLLTDASRANGRTIHLLSDEAYSEIIFDGKPYPSPATFYPNSFLIYTYGKVLLTPGERIGYIALSPHMAERQAVGQAIFTTQFVTGFAFPNSVLQHALADLDKLSIDIAHLQTKRDLMVGALREMGYSLRVPEGTFYLFVKSPLPDDNEFAEYLSEHKILVLPGTITEMPGYFRISLTANDDMIRRALPGFAAAIERAMKATELH